MAIAFCLTRPFMMSVTLSATSIAQLRNDLGAVDITSAPKCLIASRRSIAAIRARTKLRFTLAEL